MSTLKNAGFGVFAKSSFKENDVIALYCGKLLFEGEDGLNDNEYTYLDCDAGFRTDCCFGRYVLYYLLHIFQLTLQFIYYVCFLDLLTIPDVIFVSTQRLGILMKFLVLPMNTIFPLITLYIADFTLLQQPISLLVKKSLFPMDLRTGKKDRICKIVIVHLTV